MIVGYTDAIKRALHDPREFQKLLDEDAKQLQAGIRDMIIDINWQITQGSNKDDQDWKRRATFLKSKLERHVAEVNSVVKEQNIQRTLREDFAMMCEWRDLAHDLYDFIVEKMGSQTEVADWHIPAREAHTSPVSTINEWYIERQESLKKESA